MGGSGWYLSPERPIGSCLWLQYSLLPISLGPRKPRTSHTFPPMKGPYFLSPPTGPLSLA